MRRFDLSGLKVALVYPPYGAIKNEPGIKAVKENYGVFPSLSLLYVAGVLEAHGVEVEFIDANAEGLPVEEAVERLRRFGPDYVGYTVTTYLFHQTMAWVDAIKAALPDLPVIAGGVHMGMYPLVSMSHRSLDFAVTGEAEVTLPELLHRLRKGERLDGLMGLVWRGPDGEPIYNGPAPLLRDIDDAAEPARHLIDNSLYYSFISKYKNFSALMTSRGCPFRCIFCEQGGLRFRPRSPQSVVDEIELGYREFGIREYDFFDSAFTIQKDRVIAIAQEILRRKLPVIWAARTRVDSVNAEMLQWMGKAGCTRIYYGLESGNRQILRTLMKAADLDQARDAIRWTREAGIDTFGYFMVGNPGETDHTVRQTIRYALSLDLDYAQFSKVTPMPGTALYDMYLAEFGEDYWERTILEPDYDEFMRRPGTDLSEERVQELTQLAYLRFYYRPLFAARSMARVKSWGELRRSAATALQMLLQTPEGHSLEMDLS